MLKMQEVESGVNRHQYEASELKVQMHESKQYALSYFSLIV